MQKREIVQKKLRLLWALQDQEDMPAELDNNLQPKPAWMMQLVIVDMQSKRSRNKNWWYSYIRPKAFKKCDVCSGGNLVLNQQLEKLQVLVNKLENKVCADAMSC